VAQAWCELTRSASLDAILAHPHSAGGSWDNATQRKLIFDLGVSFPRPGMAQIEAWLTTRFVRLSSPATMVATEDNDRLP
jgi:hypothetical protein